MAKMNEYEKQILEYFLNTVNLILCSCDDDFITFYDITDNIKKDIILNCTNSMIDYNGRYLITNDFNSKFSIKAGVSKYGECDFLKNGVKRFELESLIDDMEDKIHFVIADEYNLYNIFIMNQNNNRKIVYRISSFDGNIVNVDYEENDDSKYLEILNIINNRRNSLIISDGNICIKDDNKSINYDLPSDMYFDYILSKIGHVINQSNDSIKALNSELFELVLEHYDFFKDFINIKKMGKNSIHDTNLIKFFDIYSNYNFKVNNYKIKKKVF